MGEKRQHLYHDQVESAKHVEMMNKRAKMKHQKSPEANQDKGIARAHQSEIMAILVHREAEDMESDIKHTGILLRALKTHIICLRLLPP